MEINGQIYDILKEFRIKQDVGVLVLLGIYHNLDVEAIIPEEVIKSINLTKIVEKDYKNKSITWNVPLFTGQETAFEWVKDWMEAFGRINPERKGSTRDVLSRMKDFFKKYPEYRKDDIYKARDLYLSSLNNPKYLMHSHKFIFDGMGAMKKSTLLAYCEKVTSSNTVEYQKGKVLS